MLLPVETGRLALALLKGLEAIAAEVVEVVVDVVVDIVEGAEAKLNEEIPGVVVLISWRSSGINWSRRR